MAVPSNSTTTPGLKSRTKLSPPQPVQPHSPPLQPPLAPEMTGGTMFESQSHMHHGQELMTEWTPNLGGMSGMRRKTELLNDRSMPSPTYPHASPVESTASPYTHPQNIILPGSAPSFHGPYPSMSGSHLHPLPQPRFPQPLQNQYYPTGGGYDVFQTPNAPTDRGRPGSAPFGEQPGYTQTPQHYEATPAPVHSGAPLLTTTTLSRTYDSTIPQYYPVTTDKSMWAQTPDKEIGQKRKRAPKDTPPHGNKALKTPKQAKSARDDGSGRSGKRVKVEDGRTVQQFQLPTPPTTGREISSVSLPRHLRIPDDHESMATESVKSVDEPQRRGVYVTRHQDEGRKLAVGGMISGSEEPVLSPRKNKPERKTPIPSLTTNEVGHAILSTDLVLESELAWLENGGRSTPPSSPDLATIQTPVMATDVMVEEEPDTPATKARKMTKRLQAFADPSRTADEPMVCTRIDLFGRVAVRKDVAIKFLGLEDSANASVVEEVRGEEEDEWIERSIASSSKVTIKPSWPDDMAPWSLAGGSRRERMLREETEKANILRRYLEAVSDESSDEDAIVPMVYGKGKGKSVSRLVSYSSSEAESRRRTHQSRWDNTTADAKSALLTTLRNRALPVIGPGVVACACGAPTVHGLGAMMACASCKRWHHFVCNNIEDEAQLRGRWWCPTCEHQAIALSTPARSTPRRGYSQSDERSSAFKGELTTIALAPSPMFNTTSFSHASTTLRTPLNRNISSPSRPHRSRILSYGTDMWAYTEDGPPGATPSTPAPAHDRFSTPRIDDAPFDVTSTPSRHLDFNFGQPSLFQFTPLGGGRSRLTSNVISDTPLTLRARKGADGGSGVPSRHDFLRDLGKGAASGDMPAPGSPQARWPLGLLGTSHNLSPSPFSHRRSLSGNKMSSMRSSSRSGLGLGLPLEREEECK